MKVDVQQERRLICTRSDLRPDQFDTSCLRWTQRLYETYVSACQRTQTAERVSASSPSVREKSDVSAICMCRETMRHQNVTMLTVGAQGC
jgi:hypothetical protein